MYKTLEKVRKEAEEISGNFLNSMHSMNFKPLKSSLKTSSDFSNAENEIISNC